MRSDHWQPQLVALDVDGTLLAWATGQGGAVDHLTDAVRDSVRAAQAAGAVIVLASGRSVHSMEPILDALGLGNPEAPVWAVASNGAVVFRYPPTDIVHEVTFDARPAVEQILAEQPHMMIAVEERGIGYRLNQAFPVGELEGEMILTDTTSLLKSLLNEPVSRVIIRDPAATANDFIDLAARLGLHGINYVVGWTAWLDLSPIGVDKASGMKWVCDQLAISPEHVLAMGDGRNDKEMLAWAGRGVAMGQAIPEVKAIADAVTGTVDEDGVATELARYFPTSQVYKSPSSPGKPIPWRPRVIATDLDGTLLHSDYSVSERTAAALAAAEAAGIAVVFVTGRPLRWMSDLFAHVGAHGTAILSNGALVWDVAAQKAIAKHGIDREAALQACADLRKTVPGVRFGIEDIRGLSVEPHFIGSRASTHVLRHGSLDEIIDQPPLKILARHRELSYEEFALRARECIGDVLEVTGSTGIALLEMSAKGVTKASALQTWCAERGFKATDVVAFGDMPNDLDMLAWAGQSYAMANAHPRVHALAGTITASNNDDGVAQILETFLS